MADVKISGLPASTVPLAGTEVLPVVQGGATKQVSIANVTAGRAISASTIQATTTVGVGAATPAASGAGITFPATQSASTDVNTLDDYEEGSWTPAFSSDGTAPTTPYTMSIVFANYVKIGSLVTVSTYFSTDNVNITGASGNLIVSGLPFSASGSVGFSAISVTLLRTWVGFPCGGFPVSGTTTIRLEKRLLANGATSYMTASDLTAGAVAGANLIILTATYTV